MSSTEILYAIGDMFQTFFIFYDKVGNYFNDFLIVFGFFAFGYWMNLQRKFNAASNVPVEIKDNAGWYKENADKKILK